MSNESVADQYPIVGIRTVKEVLTSCVHGNLPLAIPDYQRPYKWQAFHVNQLLDDLCFHQDKKTYRLGTVVLHQDDNKNNQDDSKLNIVDGQQRLVTLTLIAHELSTDIYKLDLVLLEQKFPAPESIVNIQTNHQLIKQRIGKLNPIAKENLREFLLNHCELVYVILNNLSEAFQFFDSQNARGKPLEPYDLLKAFHLREMDDCSDAEKRQYVLHWEQSVIDQKVNLSKLMNDVLFPLRSWAIKQSGENFTRKELAIFKGVRLTQDRYNYCNALRALDTFIQQYNQDTSRKWDLQQHSYPFQVTQTIINGRRFFEYVEHYRQLYQRFFVDKQCSVLNKYIRLVTSYKGSHRTGDGYVRELFYATLLLYYDKFGENGLVEFIPICFAWCYRIRLTFERVGFNTIDNTANEHSALLQVVMRVVHPRELLSYYIKPMDKNEIKQSINELVMKMKDLGYYHE